MLKQVYIDTARETGFKAGPEHFGYLLMVFCADTDEKAHEIGRNFMWTYDHRLRGPREHLDYPGYQSREAVRVKTSGDAVSAISRRMTYEERVANNTVIAGNPETVAKKLAYVVEKLSPGYLHLYGNEGPMEHPDVMRSIELMGKEVLPALREIKLQPYE